MLNIYWTSTMSSKLPITLSLSPSFSFSPVFPAQSGFFPLRRGEHTSHILPMNHSWGDIRSHQLPKQYLAFLYQILYCRHYLSSPPLIFKSLSLPYSLPLSPSFSVLLSAATLPLFVIFRFFFSFSHFLCLCPLLFFSLSLNSTCFIGMKYT